MLTVMEVSTSTDIYVGAMEEVGGLLSPLALLVPPLQIRHVSIDSSKRLYTPVITQLVEVSKSN